MQCYSHSQIESIELGAWWRSRETKEQSRFADATSRASSAMSQPLSTLQGASDIQTFKPIVANIEYKRLDSNLSFSIVFAFLVIIELD